MLRKVGSWMAGYASARRRNGATHRPEQYLKFVARLPAILRFIPAAGALGDIRRYLTLFCYFLQPTPANIRSMILYAIRSYVPGYEKRIKVDPPESRPAMGIYHPDAPSLFQSFDGYQQVV